MFLPFCLLVFFPSFSDFAMGVYSSLVLITTQYSNKNNLTFSPLLQDDAIETRRACVLKALIVYLNEDPEALIREYIVSFVTSALHRFSL